MKVCPRCKKEVAEHAKICPYCGYHLETGYQPMKKRKRNSFVGFMYIIMAFIFMFSPMLIGYFFSSDNSFAGPSINEDSKELIILGPLGDVKNQEEYIDIQFDDLDKFGRRVKDVKPMVTNIKNFEKQLGGLTEQKIDKDYEIVITDLNNIYYNLTYTIPLEKHHSVELRMVYDMAKETNEVRIRSYREKNTSFEEIQYNVDDYELMNDIVALITGDEKDTLLDTSGKEFNTLEKSFEERKKTLGHYGLGINKIKEENICSIYVSGYVDDYTVKCEYQTKLKINKFISKK